MRTLIVSGLLGLAMLFGGTGNAEACHKTTCYYPVCYYVPVQYVPATTYHVWHVYQTNPVTGAPEILKRYLTKEEADNDPNVVGKKAYVIEYLYYAY
ncbi:MAG: hypothetical protein ACYC61_01720 [Isosphaeraceae bacterium]